MLVMVYEHNFPQIEFVVLTCDFEGYGSHRFALLVRCHDAILPFVFGFDVGEFEGQDVEVDVGVHAHPTSWSFVDRLVVFEPGDRRPGRRDEAELEDDLLATGTDDLTLGDGHEGRFDALAFVDG